MDAQAADRWIVKNPRSAVVTANAIRTFEFNGDQYAVVKAPQFSTLAADLFASSDSVSEDMRITLPRVTAAETPDQGTTAWHVAKLQYDQLPADANGTGVTVAVIDTGVDYTHSALKDHMWTNAGEIAGNGIDDDGNGQIDDVYGFDFTDDDSDPVDGDAHGTHCAGAIASSMNPTSLAQGIAPGAKIMAVRIIGDEQMGFLSDAVAGIKYAADNGAKVMSNSWRVYQSWRSYDPSDVNVELLRQAIIYAGEKGAIFVAAAGNESRDLDSNADKMFPGGFEGLANLVVVAASGQNDGMTYFSNYGPAHVSVAAPGDNIISTVPGNEWESMSGTSMATPIVAGAIARGLSATYSTTDAIEKLVTTSTMNDTWKTRIRAPGVISVMEYLKRQ
jgi:subtilisin family serine protease